MDPNVLADDEFKAEKLDIFSDNERYSKTANV